MYSIKSTFLKMNYIGLGATHKLCCLGKGEGGSPKDDLLQRHYLIKKTTRGGGGQNMLILR